MDAWFAGFQPSLVAITWIGYDTPRKLGDRETGGGLSLPVWISFMQEALKNVAVQEYLPPAGVVFTNGDWYYTEFANGAGVTALGEGHAPAAQVAPTPSATPSPNPTNATPANKPADERSKILDLFR